jgi:hypothetical protein
MKRFLSSALAILLFGLLNVSAQVRIYTPELVSPANGAINQTPDVVLNWNAVTGGNTGIILYDVQLDTDPAFSSPVAFHTELVSAVQTSGLMFGETYYWRVRATDGPDVSEWSATWSFRVVIRVTLDKPLEANNLKKTDVTLEWKAITGLTAYHVQIDSTGYWTMLNSGSADDILGVDMVNDTATWMVGTGGLILHYDGETITGQESGTSDDLFGVSFVDIDNGWAVGEGGTIIHYNGTVWSEQASPVTTDLYAVCFVDASNGWAVGKGGKVVYYNGTEWSTQYTASKDLLSVSFTDASQGWASAKGGVIIVFDGTAWTDQPSGVTRDLFAIAAAGDGTAWALGKSGTILKYEAGSWSTYPVSLTTKDLLAVSFASPTRGWAVGTAGTAIEFDGIEWFGQSAGTGIDLKAISLMGETQGFAAGNGGFTATYNPDAFGSPVAATVSVGGSTLTHDFYDLYFGTTYSWRVKAMHNEDESSWSGARSFLTATTVELDKPNNNATNQNLDLVLKWKALTDRVSYDIQVDDDPAFGSPIQLATGQIQIVAEQLTFGILYNWRVRAHHVNDFSAWSAPFTFTTVNQLTLVDPPDGAIDVKITPILSWNALTGITGYQVQFNSSDDFTSPLVNEVITDDAATFAVPFILEKSTQYFWRARAIAVLDSSAWSPVFDFTTVEPVGLGEPTPMGQLSIYPNPASLALWIQIDNPESSLVRVSVTDLLGKSLLDTQLEFGRPTSARSIDVSGLSKGIYLLKLSDGQRVITRKLIIDR